MAKQQSTNQLPDLSKFDYSNLKGKSFSEYLDVLDTLQLNEKYDFEEWLATSDMEKEFDRKTGKVNSVMVGITLNGNKPIATTRITLLMAIELNKHINQLNTPDSRGTSKYYLLKKEVKNAN